MLIVKTPLYLSTVPEPSALIVETMKGKATGLSLTRRATEAAKDSAMTIMTL